MGPDTTSAVINLAGWRELRLRRALAAAGFAVTGVGLAMAFWLLSLMFSVWSSPQGPTERLVELGCIVVGLVGAALILWPVLGDRRPRLVLTAEALVIHHPDLPTDLVVPRGEISGVCAEAGVDVPRRVPLIGTASLGPANTVMLFRSPQQLPFRPWATLGSGMGSPLGTRRGLRGLRLQAADPEWARQVLGTMPQYRALAPEDYAAAGVDRSDPRPSLYQAAAALGLAAAYFYARSRRGG